jgi:hypothetical protein
MAYIGNTPTTQSFISGTDYFNGTGSQTAFTLTRTVASQNDVEAVVNNVVQQPNAGYTISGTTITFTSAPSAGTQNVYVRYLSTTTQSIAPGQGTVGWNQLNTDTQQDLGISFKNRIINGNMAIDQRNAGASVTPTANAYTLDRWTATLTQASKFSVQQNAGSVTPPTGFTNYLGITSTSAYSVVSSDVFTIRQSIEGFNTSDLDFGKSTAKTITLSFWVRSSLTGTFGGALKNSAADRSYPFTYTISSANTWEYKTITVAGDTTGTWLVTNGIGLIVSFGLGVGSTFNGTAGAWAAGNFNSATGATSVVGTNGATFYLTGVMLEVGTQATTFTLAGGSYGAELALCQRYYEQVTGSTSEQRPFGIAYAASTTSVRLAFYYKQQKRATPTIAGTTARVSNATDGTSPTIELIGPDTAIIGYTTSGLTANNAYVIFNRSGSADYIAFSSEL